MWNDHAQIGMPNDFINGYSIPQPVVVDNAIEISDGGDRSCVIVAGGVVKCWGRNDYGQLGNGVPASRNAGVATSTVACSSTCAAEPTRPS